MGTKLIKFAIRSMKIEITLLPRLASTFKVWWLVHVSQYLAFKNSEIYTQSVFMNFVCIAQQKQTSTFFI
jgi:hypothetical protein